MQVQDVITLEDNLEYLLVTEIELDNQNYFLAVGVEGENIYTEDHFFCKSVKEEDGEYIDEVTDELTIKTLYNLLAAQESMEEFPEIIDKIIEEDSI